VIAGATRPEQIAANVAAGDWRPDDDVLREVDVIAPAHPPAG
jgi:aryl-alcohol dehydrogenase-like predicted oxidoreductase